jgi:hypothetical protein
MLNVRVIWFSWLFCISHNLMAYLDGRLPAGFRELLTQYSLRQQNVAISISLFWLFRLRVRNTKIRRSQSFLLLPTHSRCRGCLFAFHLITLRHTPQSVGLLWTRDRPVAQTSTWQHTNTHKRQTSMPPLGFEPTIPASTRPKPHALDRAATGVGYTKITDS